MCFCFFNDTATTEIYTYLLTLSLHDALPIFGHAHSVEVWDGARLVGGVYGLAIGQLFCGESMFSAESGGFRLALVALADLLRQWGRSEEHTSELQSLMRTSYAVFCLKKKKQK